MVSKEDIHKHALEGSRSQPLLCHEELQKEKKETLAYHWPLVPLMHIFFRDLCTKQKSRDNPWTVILSRLLHHPVYSRPMTQTAEGMLVRVSWFILRWWNKHCLSSYSQCCPVFTRSAETGSWSTGAFESCLLQLAPTFPLLQDCDSCRCNRIFSACELKGSTAV